FEVEVDTSRIGLVEQPTAVGLLLRPHYIDGLDHARVGLASGTTEVVQRSQHVVVPVVRECKTQIPGIDDLTRALAPEQAALEQILLAAAARLGDLWRATGPLLELDEPVEHVDRRVERGAHRPVLGLTVPPAVGHSFADDPLDDVGHIDAEVRTGFDRAPVDARLDLAVEVVLAGVLPSPVLGDAGDSLAGRLADRIEAQPLACLKY